MPSRFRELLPKAVEELEQRWAARALGAREGRALCRRLLGRMNYGDQPYWDRVLNLESQMATDTRCIEDDIVELETQWRERTFDNYKDIISDCDQMLACTDAHPALQKRVVGVLGHVIGEIETIDDPIVAKYLGAWGTRTHWETVLGGPLARTNPRAGADKKTGKKRKKARQ